MFCTRATGINPLRPSDANKLHTFERMCPAVLTNQNIQVRLKKHARTQRCTYLYIQVLMMMRRVLHIHTPKHICTLACIPPISAHSAFALNFTRHTHETHSARHTHTHSHAQQNTFSASKKPRERPRARARASNGRYVVIASPRVHARIHKTRHCERRAS